MLATSRSFPTENSSGLPSLCVRDCCLLQSTDRPPSLAKHLQEISAVRCSPRSVFLVWHANVRTHSLHPHLAHSGRHRPPDRHDCLRDRPVRPRPPVRNLPPVSSQGGWVRGGRRWLRRRGPVRPRRRYRYVNIPPLLSHERGSPFTKKPGFGSYPNDILINPPPSLFSQALLCDPMLRQEPSSTRRSRYVMYDATFME